MMDENSHPPTKMPSLDKNDGTDTGLPIDQSNVMTNSPLESLDSQMVSNTSKSEIPQAKSGNSDGGAEQEDVAVNTATKRKRYQRHSQHQIQELEAYFMDCPHPNEKQRKVLSEALGLEPLQVKFWFQNKRTQMKAKHERHESTHLRSENDKLKADNERFKELLANLSCPTCGDQCFSIAFHENKLRLENARLKQELERISSVAETIIGRRGFRNNHTGFHSLNPLDFVLPPPYSTPQSVNGEAFNNVEENVTMMGPIIGSSEVEKPFIIDIALGAMEEFVQMAHLQEPLWFSTIENGTSLLNEEEYFRRFPRGIGPRPIGFITEATRETAVVIMNPINLVEIIMDVNYWSSMFAGVVSRVSTIDVLSAGVPGNYNGAIQVILAEIQVPTPQVPTRECYFVRYCKHRADGTWAIVDVSLDHLRAGQAARCRKRPSGCFIEQMPNGYSKVAWVEHVEVDNTSVPDIYKPLLSCGLAFGAKRWLATLDRQCERLASAMATYVPTNDMSNGLLSNHESRKSMLKLVERMVNSFTSGVSASTGNQWTTLSSGNGTADNVRVMTRISLDDPGKPPGIVLCAATSIWLPVPPNAVFEFLRDQKNRAEWDILSNGGTVEEMAHMANGREIGNCVSFLKVNGEEVDQSDMLILQESSTDPAGSYVIYAPVDVSAMNLVLNGGEPDHIALLPSGFAILPDGPPPGNIMSRGSRAIYKNDLSGSLLTVAFQILVDSVPTAKFSMGSIATVNSLIACTITRIKRSLLAETGPHS